MDFSALGRAFSGGGVNPGGPDPNQNTSALSKIGAGLQGATAGWNKARSGMQPGAQSAPQPQAQTPAPIVTPQVANAMAGGRPMLPLSTQQWHPNPVAAPGLGAIGMPPRQMPNLPQRPMTEPINPGSNGPGYL